MLVDRAKIFVRSGAGGNGCISFRREKFIPKGGPNGGNGGRGGDVILIARRSVATLLGVGARPHYRAKRGDHGTGKSCTGADGASCEVEVPLGTLVFDDDSGLEIADLIDEGQRFLVAQGGRGGLGNEYFKSSTNQTPRESTDGEPAVDRTLRLELKLLADVGLIGLPNAGKSTLLSALTEAHPKVADYPFTTLRPHLGMAELRGDRRFVLADIPGLIKGAARGAGLGYDFLRHVERTSTLVHVIDVASMDGSDAVQNYFTIRAELEEHSETLASKPEIVAINKVDLVMPQDIEEVSHRLMTEAKLASTPLVISGATHLGLEALLETCWKSLTPDDSGWRPS
ncbi:MAG: GTPase ObgE [Phycisphaerales bacterium]|nr:GTPase ObgE [Phycisphaerales bacterium]